MGFLQARDKKVVEQEFRKLRQPVKLIVFTQEFECQFCQHTREILQEVAALSDKLSVEVYDFVNDKEKVLAYQIDKIPAIAIVGERDYGIRFFGIPSGYEFSTLLEDILMVSTGESGLSAVTKTTIQAIRTPVHIQVFVTPTCPYCPGAVRMAHKLAFEHPSIRGDMVEAVEFPQLATKYDVMGVPKIVINDDVEFEGALPEDRFVTQLMSAVKT